MPNSYLTRTEASPTSTKIGTFSAWVKGNFDATKGLFSGQVDNDNRIALYFSDTLRIYGNASGSQTVYLITDQVFKDPAAWYHIVIAWDTTQGTASNRLKVYVNGEQVTSFSTESYPAQDIAMLWNTGTNIDVGARRTGSVADYWDGFMSQVVFVDGTQLTPTSFGETDTASGVWKFKSPSGITFGNNGFHLKFENSGALGTDSSGNSNTYTVQGDLKQALDRPTINHATWNPVFYRRNGGVSYKSTFSNGNNTQTGVSTNLSSIAASTLAVTQGKWYAEFKYILPNSNTNNRVGILDLDDYDQSSWIFASGASGYGYRTEEGNKEHNGTNSSYGNSCANGDIIGVAFDATNGAIWFSKNGVWQNNATISEIGAGTTTYAAFTSIPSGTWAFTSTTITDIAFQANFGNGFFGTTAISSAGSNGNGSLFEYDVPSGYYALNTKNLNTYG